MQGLKIVSDTQGLDFLVHGINWKVGWQSNVLARGGIAVLDQSLIAAGASLEGMGEMFRQHAIESR